MVIIVRGEPNLLLCAPVLTLAYHRTTTVALIATENVAPSASTPHARRRNRKELPNVTLLTSPATSYLKPINTAPHTGPALLKSSPFASRPLALRAATVGADANTTAAPSTPQQGGSRAQLCTTPVAQLEFDADEEHMMDAILGKC